MVCSCRYDAVAINARDDVILHHFSFVSFVRYVCIHKRFVLDHDGHTKKGKGPVIHKDIIPLKPELEYTQMIP